MLNEHVYLGRNAYLVIFIKVQILALIEYCDVSFMYILCISVGQVSRATRSVIWPCDLVTNLYLNLSHVIERHDG